jgi:hypothetical protein
MRRAHDDDRYDDEVDRPSRRRQRAPVACRLTRCLLWASFIL